MNVRDPPALSCQMRSVRSACRYGRSPSRRSDGPSVVVRIGSRIAIDEPPAPREGEMLPRTLAETTLDAKTRTLLRVTIDSNLEADKTFEELLGKLGATLAPLALVSVGYQLRLAARAREMVDQGLPVEAACRIIILEDQLEEALREMLGS